MSETPETAATGPDARVPETDDTSETGTAGTAGEKAYRVEHPTPRRKRRATKVAAGLLGLSSLALLGYGYLVSGRSPGIETSEVTEFQEGGTGSGFGRIGLPEPETAQSEAFDFSPLQDQLANQRSALEARNDALQRQVRELQDTLAGLTDAAAGDASGLLADLTAALEEAQAQNAALSTQMRTELTTQIEALQAENDRRLTTQADMLQSLQRENRALQEQLAAAPEAAQTRALDQQCAAEQAARRRLAAAQLEARVRSASVVYDGGATAATGGAGGGTSSGQTGQAPSRDESLRGFVTGGGTAVPLETAEVIAHPAHTILQGTLIQASLETALDSSLPGQVSAIVNYPVWSFDQSQVLIPSGSRVFGSYSSDVAIGQGRILIGWTRLVTPDGQSVTLSAFGGDQMGRSGVTGHVNTRFGTRFGNAALISLVGAMPAIAAAQVSDDATSELVEDLGADLSTTTNAAAAQYATLPPIITVEQGTAITIMVDRDLAFF